MSHPLASPRPWDFLNKYAPVVDRTQTNTPATTSHKILRVSITSKPANHGKSPEKSARSMEPVDFGDFISFVICHRN